MRLTHGHINYTLDDPYIHLALAENIAHGHYGINPTESTSPSSSVLWPFLLVPFAGTPFHADLPLVENIVFGTLSAFLIGYALATWPPNSGHRDRLWQVKQVITGILLIFCANLAGLTFVGMEHVLQVLLAISCAFGCAKALNGHDVPKWCVAAAILAPAVRYEDLGLTLAISFAIAGQRKWRQAIMVFVCSLIPLALFSAFLLHNGLSWLPLSVLVKGDYVESSSVAVRTFHVVANGIRYALFEPDRLPIAVLTAAFAALAWNTPSWARRSVFLGAALLGLGQILVGQFGWNHRYEVYALIFLLLLLLRVVAERPPISFAVLSLALMFFAATYIHAAVEVPWNVHDYYFEQHQMHRFVTQYYSGDYAVNDLGLVSFQRRPGAYVLDLFGLASVDASKHQSNRSAEWLSNTVKQHNVHLAIIYEFPFQIPPKWAPEAKMCIRRALALPPQMQCVSFYSTDPTYDEIIRHDLVNFARDSPQDVEIKFSKPGNESLAWVPDRILDSKIATP
ncbi:MAG: hypothetical protein NVSMB62_00190 [Acidobacteriaceae bacterium]